MVEIKNDMISVEINTLGAEMRKITVNGEDRLWSGDPAFWSGTAPVMFPICGGLPDDVFTYNGNEYSLVKHGFARLSEFEVEKATDISATFLLKSNKDTIKMYPWDFEFRITYTLRGSTIKIDYDVKNLSNDTMYVSPGAHEAYSCPDGIENYDVIFEKKETLNACVLDGNLIAHETKPIIKESNILPLYTRFFEVDALVFKDLKSRSATLRNRVTGQSVTVNFEGFDYFLLWQKAGAGYICMEPWTGIPPMVDAGKDITEKEGITAVAAGDTLKLTHSISF